MIKSMTGFGRAQETIDGMLITVEVKSVNHRYFEFTAKVPRAYLFLEEKLKTLFSKDVTRGKVECFVTIETLSAQNSEVFVDLELAKSYLDAIRQISEALDLQDNVSALSISQLPDVVTLRKAPSVEDKIWNAVETVAEDALKNFVEMRKIEGEKLKQDVLSRAELILSHVSFIESRSPQTVREYNDKLKQRMQELLDNAEVDEQRLLNEAAIYADKIAVDEETVRLRSHIAQLCTFMEADEPIGRKTDFLVQEINREANTIGSKAQDVEIAKHVIAIKAEVEKIREQIQNIE